MNKHASNSGKPTPWNYWSDLLSILDTPEYSEIAVVAHAVYMAFLFRVSHSYQPAHFLRSWSILLGQPVGWLTNNKDLYLYTVGFFIVFGNPVVYPFMKAVRPMSEGFLDLVNAAFCAQTLIKFQALVVKCAPSGATTTIPQIFIGTLSITGGGILYDWCFNSSIRFAFPGYEFAVAALVNAFYAYQSNPANRKFFFSLVWNSLPMKTIREFGFSENIFRFWKFFVETFVQAAKLAGVPVVFRGKTGDADLKALCALLLIVGFWLRPGKWITTWDAYTNFSAGGGGVTKNDRKTENETVGEGETVAALQETVDNSEKTKANIKKRHKHKPDETH